MILASSRNAFISPGCYDLAADSRVWGCLAPVGAGTPLRCGSWERSSAVGDTQAARIGLRNHLGTTGCCEDFPGRICDDNDAGGEGSPGTGGSDYSVPGLKLAARRDTTVKTSMGMWCSVSCLPG